jgi:BlaI family penicillinase repressor
MPPLPSISDAEWEVMNLLWASIPDRLTAADVVAGLAGRKDWSPRTVKTLLNRLVKKKAVNFDADGNRYLYYPAIKRDECVRNETRSFLNRVFGGAMGPMLAHFVSHSKLSSQEIAELKRLLAEKQQRDRSREKPSSLHRRSSNGCGNGPGKDRSSSAWCCWCERLSSEDRSFAGAVRCG